MGMTLVGGCVDVCTQVVSMDISPQGAVTACDAAGAGPGSVIFIDCKMANDSAVESAVAQAVERLGGSTSWSMRRRFVRPQRPSRSTLLCSSG